jgi:hypothetical protein
VVMQTTIRANAIEILKAIRSKAIDTERRLLLDRITEQELKEKADQIRGLTHTMELAILENWEPKHDDAA